jgi:fatty-acid desaturase
MKRFEFKFAENALVRAFFRDILTGKDGDSYDLGRVLGMFGFLGYMLFGTVQMGMAVHQLWLHNTYVVFPFLEFSTGFGAIALGTGGLIWAKKDTEPTKPEEPPA